MNSIFLGVIGALSVACLFPRDWGPWCDLDRGFRYLLGAFLRTPGWSLSDHAWRKSYSERVSLLKYATWGLILILVLPLNALTSCSWLVDGLWRGLGEVRDVLSTVLGKKPGEMEILRSVRNWRDAQYNLWEICVFLWVFPIVGDWIKCDYVRLAEHTHADNVKENVGTGQLLAIFIGLFSLLGLLCLVILDSPKLRLLVELLVVVVLTIADLFFWRKWRTLSRQKAIGHLEVFLIVEVGALVGFMSLWIFFETSLSYGSPWSNPFVAGASALNLLFANTASLVLRGVQGYREAGIQPSSPPRPIGESGGS